MFRFAAILIMIFVPFLALNGQTKEELEREKLSTLKELELARDLLDKTKTKKEHSIRRVSLLNRGINSREDLIRTIEKEIEELDQIAEDIRLEIEELDRSIKQGKEEYAQIIYSVYKNHTEEETLMFLLASESINQFYQRVKYLKYLKDYRERKIDELELLISLKEERSTEILRIRNEKASLLEEKETESQQLLREREQRSRLIRQLTQDERQIRREIAEKERIRKELETKIREMIEAEAKRSSANSLVSSLTPEQRLVGNNFLQNQGRLPWPVERGVITSKFGLIDHPVLSGVKISNNGIDISTEVGTKARAVFDGEVTSVFAILGANYAVIVMHGEYLSVYQNLDDLKVKVGDKVVAKQEIGTVHADPEENVAVIQLQIWKSREILDPENWLSK